MRLSIRELLVFVFIAFLSFEVSGVEPAIRQSTYTSGRVGSPESIATLPKHVTAPAGQLTLFADYGDVSGTTVTLYLVNKTDKRLAFSAQDNDLYVKLEALHESGEWERAQLHVSSWCGNSYFERPSLRPNEYFRFPGYYPSGGAQRTVRYRLFGRQAFILDERNEEPDTQSFPPLEPRFPLRVTSNAGLGRVDVAEIRQARRDDLAVPFGDFKTVRDLAVGNLVGDGQRMERYSAIRALSRFPTEDSLRVLERLVADSDAGAVRAAVGALAVLGLNYEFGERRFQELLHSENPQHRSYATRGLIDRPITTSVINLAKRRLYDDELQVRVAALSVLARRCADDPEIKRFVNDLFDDPDPRIVSTLRTVLVPTCVDYQSRSRERH